MRSGCTSSARTWSCTASSGCQSGSCFDSLSLFLIDTCVWFERTRQSATQRVVFIFYVFSQTTSSSANVMDIASTWWDVLSTFSSRHRGDVVDVCSDSALTLSHTETVPLWYFQKRERDFFSAKSMRRPVPLGLRWVAAVTPSRCWVAWFVIVKRLLLSCGALNFLFTISVQISPSLHVAWKFPSVPISESTRTILMKKATSGGHQNNSGAVV